MRAAVDEEAAIVETQRLVHRMSSDNVVPSSAASLTSSFEGNTTTHSNEQRHSLQTTPATGSLLLIATDEEDRRMMLRQTVAAVVFALVAWYEPRYLIYHETHIKDKAAPYQRTTTGESNDVVIVLDPLLNEPLLPQTIPSAFLVHASVTLPILVIFTAPLWQRMLSCNGSSSFSIVAMFRSMFTMLWGQRRGGAATTETTTTISLALWQMQGRFCAFCTALGLSEGTTQLLKLMIQRRRPNFYALCQFDKTALKCTNSNVNQLREANFSFPSGHSSLTCCAMTFLMWLGLSIVVAQATDSCRSSNNKRTPSRWWRLSRLEALQCKALVAILLPFGWTLFVASSRLMDRWHHPADVVAGLCLGFTMATIGYHVWFPPIWWRSNTSTCSIDYPWSVHMTYMTPLPFPPPSMLSSFNE